MLGGGRDTLPPYRPGTYGDTLTFLPGPYLRALSEPRGAHCACYDRHVHRPLY